MKDDVTSIRQLTPLRATARWRELTAVAVGHLGSSNFDLFHSPPDRTRRIEERAALPVDSLLGAYP